MQYFYPFTKVDPHIQYVQVAKKANNTLQLKVRCLRAATGGAVGATTDEDKEMEVAVNLSIREQNPDLLEHQGEDQVEVPDVIIVEPSAPDLPKGAAAAAPVAPPMDVQDR